MPYTLELSWISEPSSLQARIRIEISPRDVRTSLAIDCSGERVLNAYAAAVYCSCTRHVTYLLARTFAKGTRTLRFLCPSLSLASLPSVLLHPLR